MPRYFFDITDNRRLGGATVRDGVGIDLADTDAARTQAFVILAGAVLPKDVSPGGQWRLACREHANGELFHLAYEDKRSGE